MAIRQKLDGKAFLFEEKFDTWLDLTNLRKLNETARNHPSNLERFVKKVYGVTTWKQLCTDPWVERLKKKHNVSPHIISKFLLLCMEDESVIGSCSVVNNHSRVKVAYDASLKALEAQLGQFGDLMSPYLHEEMDASASAWKKRVGVIPEEVTASTALSLGMDDLLTKVKLLHKHRAFRKTTVHHAQDVLHENKYLKMFNADVLVSEKLISLRLGDLHFFLDHQLFLMLLNKVREFEIALLYSHVTSGVAHPKDFYLKVVKTLTYLCRLCGDRHLLESKERENEVFSFFKALEGIGVGIMIFQNDSAAGWNNTGLLEELWSGLYDEGLVDERIWHSNELVKLWLSMPACSLSEVLGLVKLCGHPDIEILKGLKKLYVRTHHKIRVDPKEVANSIRVLKSDLCKNFYLKNHRWPRVELTPEVPGSICTYILRNKNPCLPEFDLLIRQYGSSFWDKLEFSENQRFDKVECILPMLKDKSISPNRSFVYRHLLNRYAHYVDPDNEVYDDLKKVRGNYQMLREQNKEESRALLRYLLSDEMEIEMAEYLQEYLKVPTRPGITEGDWGDLLDFLVIKLTPKEKELKTEGRMFGSSPMVERNRRIVQEKNIYDMMDLYMPEQLLTCSEIDMIRKLFAFRCMREACPGHTIFQISFDFSAWNNYFRPESIDVPAGKVLDPWFGVKVYGKTMKAYKQMLVYGFADEDCIFWEGQDGGIEGLNQGTWTYCFTGAVKAALNQLNYHYRLSVKGDDCRAAIAVRNSDVMLKGHEQIKKEIGDVLAGICERFGYTLKPQESFVSITLIASSKQYQINNTWLPNVMKKLLKVPSFSNLIYPTVSDKISSMFSNAHSACGQGTDSICVWFTTAIIASRFLLSSLPDLRALEVCVLLIWPQILGGPGSLPLQSFIVRGENDLLSMTLSLFQHLIQKQWEGASLLWNILTVRDKEKGETNTLLLSDCYSLRRDHPASPKMLLRRAIRAGLEKITKNVTICALLEASSSADAEMWVKVLMSMRPFYPKIATALWECLPYYLVEELISKFDNSQTVFRLIALTGSRRKTINVHRVMSGIIRAEEEQLVFWESILNGEYEFTQDFYSIPRKEFETKCHSWLAQHARESSWGIKPIVGITYPSLLSQVWYVEAPTLNNNPKLFKYEKFHFTYTYDASLLNHELSMYPSHHYSSLPGLVPWLGHTTSSRLKLPQVSINKLSPPLQKVKRLMALKQRCKVFGADLAEICSRILGAYTYENPDTLRVLEPECSGGSVAHRLETNSFSRVTMPNYRPNILQIIKRCFETNALCRGDLCDMSINFAARCYLDSWVLTIPLQFQEKLERVHRQFWTIIHDTNEDPHHYIPCPTCYNDVSDQVIDFSGGKPTVRMYRHLDLVGLSKGEEKYLKDLMSELVDLRAKDLITSKGLPATVELVELANLVTATQLVSQRSTYSSVVRSLNTVRLPEGAAAEILCQTSGVPAPSDIGLNDIRCMPAEMLANALARELWIFLLGEYDRKSGIRVRHMINTLPSYKIPIKGTIEMIHVAGKLPSVVAAITKAYPGPAQSITSTVLMSPASATSWIFKLIGRNILDDLEHGARPPRVLMSVRLENLSVISIHCEKIQTVVFRLTLSRFVKSGLSLKQLMKFGTMPVCPPTPVSTTDSSSDEEGGDLHQPPHINWASVKVVKDLVTGNAKKLPHFGVVQSQVDNWIGDELAKEGRFESLLFTLALPLVLGQLEKLPVDPEVIEHALTQGIPTVPIIGLDTDAGPILWDSLQNHPSFGHLTDNISEDFWKQLCLWCDELMDSDYQESLLGYVNATYNTIAQEDKEVTICKLNLEDAIRVIRANPDKTWSEVTEHYKRGVILEKSLGPFTTTCTECKHPKGIPFMCYTHPRPVVVGQIPARIEELHINRIMESIPKEQEYYIMRAAQSDYPSYNYLTRVIGNTNTSVTKFVECLDTLGLDLEVLRQQSSGENMTCLCTADGAGGVTAMFLRFHPGMVGVYNSLMTTDANEFGPPPEVLLSFAEEDISRRLTWNIAYPGDLTDRHTVDSLIVHCKTHNISPSFITCDAEAKDIDGSNTYPQLLVNFFRLCSAVARVDSIIILKTFLCRKPEVWRVIMDLGASAGKIHFIKPLSSHSRSSEFYMVCTSLDLEAMKRRSSNSVPMNFSQEANDCLLYFISQVMDWRQGLPKISLLRLEELFDVYLQIDPSPLNLSAFYHKLQLLPPGRRQSSISLEILMNTAKTRHQALGHRLLGTRVGVIMSKSGTRMAQDNQIFRRVVESYLILTSFLSSGLDFRAEDHEIVHHIQSLRAHESADSVLATLLGMRAYGATSCLEHPHCLTMKGFIHIKVFEVVQRGLDIVTQVAGWILYIRRFHRTSPEALQRYLEDQGADHGDIISFIGSLMPSTMAVEPWDEWEFQEDWVGIDD